MPQRQLGWRYWVETIAGGIAGFLGLLTLLWRDWIEAVFGVDPDHHNGSLEWVIVGVLMLVALTCGALARLTWQHSYAATPVTD